VLDGVYVRDDEGALRFHELGDPTHEEITDVARWTHERLDRVLERHNRSLDDLAGDDGAVDLLAREQPVLASCYEASTADRQLLGDAPGQQTRKLAHAVREVAKRNDALAEVGGVNVHAGAAVPSRDRQRLERLCRYVARPPIAQDRLELTADGRCRYDFRHAWKNGVHAVLLHPLDFIARLCALIPPPRFHMLRYHGVLAAHAKARPEVVPGPVSVPTVPTQIPLSLGGAATELEVIAKQPARHPWAWLLQRCSRSTS
jgi:hypothetical protein